MKSFPFSSAAGKFCLPSMTAKIENWFMGKISIFTNCGPLKSIEEEEGGEEEEQERKAGREVMITYNCQGSLEEERKQIRKKEK